MARGGAITLNIARTSQNTGSGCRCRRQVLLWQKRGETAGSRNLRTEGTMNIVSRTEERQFITKEFVDTLGGKTPPPYLRLHDPVQKALVEFATSDAIQKTGRLAY